MRSPRRLRDLSIRFGPPVALMALIFAMSAQSSHAEHGTFSVLLRKLAHMLEYGTLWFLCWRALGYARGPLALAAAAFALAYAASDEWHQTFVSGRQGTIRDIAIDLAGIAVAALVAEWRLRRAFGVSLSGRRLAMADR